jgi:hypothetical protein
MGKEENIKHGPEKLELPEIQGSSIREIYTAQAEALESHPNYESKKDLAAPFDMRVSQYVAYLKVRAGENYTNDMQEKNVRDFEKYWNFLNE